MREKWKRSLAGRCLALVAMLTLSACGGGASSTGTAANTSTGSLALTPSQNAVADLASEGLLIGVDSLSADYGKPQDTEAISAMAKRLAEVFDGRYAQQPEMLPGTVATTNLGGVSAVKTGVKSVPVSLTPRTVDRFFNTQTGVHFYTVSPAERDWVIANLKWFNYEGAAFYALPSSDDSLAPVYRFYNKVSGTHFYTVNVAERNEVIAKLSDIFNFEGVSWYASSGAGAGWRPIYRFFNTTTGTHFYTADVIEAGNIQNNQPIFRYEGIAYYVRQTSQVFTPLAIPDSCKVFPAPVLATGLPASYAAALVGPASVAEAFLNNQGDVAFSGQDSLLGRTVVYAKPFGAATTRQWYPAGTGTFQLLSLNSAGDLLVNSDIVDVNSQYSMPLSAMPQTTSILSGANSATTPGLKIPRGLIHRGGRFSFLETVDVASPPDHTSRYFYWNSAPSYLDGAVIGKTSDRLYRGKAPAAVNHCGYGIELASQTNEGIKWMVGESLVDQWSFRFPYDILEGQKINMVNNRRAVVGISQGWPVVEKITGFMKYRADQEVVFDNRVPLDVNEKLVAVGHSIQIVDAVAPATILPVDGFLMTSDGVATPLKGRVPALNQTGTHIFPLKINDNMQILANVELACNVATSLNALSEACGTKYAYLLTPQ